MLLSIGLLLLGIFTLVMATLIVIGCERIIGANQWRIKS